MTSEDRLTEEQQAIYDATVTAVFGDTDQASEEAGKFLEGVTDERWKDFVWSMLDHGLTLPGVTTRVRAARSLARFGASARGSVKQLLSMLNAEEPAVAAMAAYAVWRIESIPEPALSTLIRILALSDPSGRLTDRGEQHAQE